MSENPLPQAQAHPSGGSNKRCRVQDLKYEAIALDETYREITLKTSGLIPVTKAFMTNVERVYGLLRLPVAIPHVMGRIVSAVGPALVQVGRRPIHLDIPALEKPLRELLEELASVHNLNELTPSAFIGLLNTKLKALSDENSDATRDIRFLITVIINIINALPFTTDASGKTYISLRLTDTVTLAWSKTFASVIALIGTPARMGFEGLLTGSIVGTWTAIEALAGDLWEAA